jgi:hypothetical protein
MELSGPRVRAFNAPYYLKLGLDDAHLARTNDLIGRALQGGKQLTRRELAEVLRREGMAGDGQWLAYRTGTVPGVRDVYARRVQGDAPPITVAAGPADEYMPAISPDGRWIAYVSLEAGKEEVYVRPVPGVDRARWQVSPAGGTNPVWAHSGRELFYVALGDSMVAASVRGAEDFQVTGRETLFSTRAFAFTPWHQAFSVELIPKLYIGLAIRIRSACCSSSTKASERARASSSAGVFGSPLIAATVSLVRCGSGLAPTSRSTT